MPKKYEYKCPVCGHKHHHIGFIMNQKGPIYFIEGEKTIVKQLFSKRQPLQAKICMECGHGDLYLEVK
jgi:hypothetical protein